MSCCSLLWNTGRGLSLSSLLLEDVWRRFFYSPFWSFKQHFLSSPCSLADQWCGTTAIMCDFLRKPHSRNGLSSLLSRFLCITSNNPQTTDTVSIHGRKSNWLHFFCIINRLSTHNVYLDQTACFITKSNSDVLYRAMTTVLQNTQILPSYTGWNSNLYSNQPLCSHPQYHEGFAY